MLWPQPHLNRVRRSNSPEPSQVQLQGAEGENKVRNFVAGPDMKAQEPAVIPSLLIMLKPTI